MNSGEYVTNILHLCLKFGIDFHFDPSSSAAILSFCEKEKRKTRGKKLWKRKRREKERSPEEAEKLRWIYEEALIKLRKISPDMS